MTPKTKTFLGWASAFALLAFIVLGARACFRSAGTPESRAEIETNQLKKTINEKAIDSTRRTPDADIRSRVWSDADVQRFSQDSGKGGSR